MRSIHPCELDINYICLWRLLFNDINFAAKNMDTNFTQLKDLDPMHDDTKILVRCISVWKTHPYGKPNDVWSFDVVLQDQQGHRVQLSVKGKQQINKFHLLNHVRGARKWEDLREFEGIVYPTCKEACDARGLLEEDKEFIDGIIEASEWGMGEYLRNYFVMLILSDTMSRPELIWEKTWKLLADDVLLLERKKQNHPDLQLSDTQRYNICLTYIEEKLLSNSKSLKNIVNMPYPNDEFTMQGYNRLIYNELDYNIPKLITQHQQLYESLTDEQRGIHEKIVDAFDNNKGGMFFVYGYGGTGKTFLYKTLTAAIRSKGRIVLNVASSGIASLLLEGGRTAHSRFAIPINIVEDSMCSISADSDLA